VAVALVKPAEPTWEELAASAVRGDPVARRDLARRCIARVRRTAALMGARGADLEDAVQATMLEAFGALAGFRGESQLTTWLDRIAVRTILRNLRRWRSLPVPAGDDIDPPSASPSPEDDVRSRLAVERVSAHLQHVKPKKRIALLLATAHGCSGEEIAEIVGCTPAAARARVLHGRRELLARARKDPALRRLATGGADDPEDAHG
jgi:RNA polymerase sigma-70 factor (ECF subfamily)